VPLLHRVELLGTPEDVTITHQELDRVGLSLPERHAEPL
jgi:protein involved in ribonucleotide reduction